MASTCDIFKKIPDAISLQSVSKFHNMNSEDLQVVSYILIEKSFRSYRMDS